MAGTGKHIGRPIKEIKWDEFDKLCSLQCTLNEIAGWFEVSEDTIERRVKERSGLSFAEFYAQRRSGGRISLRRKQFQLAMKGHPTMLIWLGKQYLEQSEKAEATVKATQEVTYKTEWGVPSKPE